MEEWRVAAAAEARREIRLRRLVRFGLIGIVLAIIGSFGLLVVAETKTRQAFMDECLQYRKQFECMAMWKGSQPNLVTFPVIIPMR